MKRVFIAIDIDDEFRYKIGKVINMLNGLNLPDIRLVKTDNIHITLKFLNTIDEERINDVLEALTGIGNRFSITKSRVTKFGVFPNMKKPHVLWLGIDNSKEQFSKIAQFIDNSLGVYGFEKDNRPFSPHITLGRFKKPIHDLPTYFNKLDKPEIDINISTVSVYESKLYQSGPIYRVIKTFHLTKKEE